MSNILNDIKLQIYKELYVNDKTVDSIDKKKLSKLLNTLLRELLKTKEYEFSVGAYKINVAPQKLSVKYETDQTVVEVSNEDIYFETIRDTETRFFCINQMIKSEYIIDNPVIKVTGTVTNIDGICAEHYLFELYTDEEDSIKNYLNLPSNATFSEINIDNDYTAMISRKISTRDKRTDVISFFENNKVVPVFFDSLIGKYKTQPLKRNYNPSDYRILLPNLDKKKRIVSYIYGTIVEFYSNVLNEKK